MGGDASTLSAFEPDRRRPLRSAAQLILVLECEQPLRSPLRIDLGKLTALSIGRGGERRLDRHGDQRELRVEDRRMSTQHARLVRGPDGWSIEDLDSKNGTWVNGARRERAPLSDGDLLELGRTFFLYCAAVAVDADEPPVVDAADLQPPAPGLATLIAPLA